MTEVWVDERHKTLSICKSDPWNLIITRPESIHTCVYMYVSGCLWAYICSCMSWIWLCLCVFVWKRENECLRQSIQVSYWDSVALDLCCAVLCVAVWSSISDFMCTDRGCFGKPESISPITALAVRLTFWICYSSLFKLEHSLISCPRATFVGSDWSACTLSQACTQCRLRTVCLQQKVGVARVSLGMKK